jgi:hypothetical protein
MSASKEEFYHYISVSLPAIVFCEFWHLPYRKRDWIKISTSDVYQQSFL